MNKNQYLQGKMSWDEQHALDEQRKRTERPARSFVPDLNKMFGRVIRLMPVKRKK